MKYIEIPKYTNDHIFILVIALQSNKNIIISSITSFIPLIILYLFFLFDKETSLEEAFLKASKN